MAIDNTKLINLSCNNIREISKKERFMGLNVKTWFVVSFVPLILQGYIGFLNGIFCFFGMLAFFYIAEFFDEDITDIFIANMTIKTPTKHFWS